jgi:hypothetical protein
MLLMASACAGGTSGQGTEPGTGPSQSPSGGGASGSASGASTTPSSGASDGGFANRQLDAAATTLGKSSGCNEVEIKFEARTPTVMLLVDRSSSMFERGFWEPLKSAVLEVVNALQNDIRFGFATYTGLHGGTCPDLMSVPIAKGNFNAIQTAYQAVTVPTFKAETPTSAAIDSVSTILKADSDPGPKFILLVTDGEPDFCDDPNPVCSRDAVVASAQAAYKQAIGTFIFSLGGDVDRTHLQDVANAGTGQGVMDHNMAVAQQCGGVRASYGSTSGTAPFFEPDATDQQALVTQLRSVSASVRSCVFELQGKLRIKLDLAPMGSVLINDQSIAYGSGWRMNSETELELLGSACDQLRRPETQRVLIDFPCEAVSVL